MLPIKPLAILQSFLFTSNATALTSSPRIVYQFPNPTWLESIAATRNGSLLTGVLGSTSSGAALHLVDPFSTANASAPANTLLYTFPDANSVFGISELEPDVYAVATGIYSTTTGATEGSSSLWTIDLNTICASGTPSVRKVADLKDTKVINGIAVLNKDTVLVADSFGGSIISVDVLTGSYKILHNDITLAENMTAAIPIGVNGLKYLAPNLYYTNTQLGVFRVRVDPSTGAATSPYTKLASLDAPDDIAVTDDGTVFVARPLGDAVERVGRDGSTAVVAEKESVRGVTGVTLGRTWRDRSVVYACTFGGYAENGEGFAEGGKIVAIQMD